jgi:hypothetical protein
MRIGITTYLNSSFSGTVISARVVAEAHLHGVDLQVGEHVEQIGDVEADVDGVAP